MEVVVGEEDLSWRNLASCNDFDPDLFFPAGDTGPAAAQIEEAKRICNECVVKPECLSFAIESNQVNGIWGGTTENERRLVRRRWMTARRRNDTALMERLIDVV
jgi:WhiB family redox-sensing transcriptional regulator